MDFQDKKVLVAGMQASGISAGYLLQKLGAKVVCFDDNPKVNLNDFEFLHTQTVDKLLEDVDIVVVSPSISQFHSLIVCCNEKNIPVLSELELSTRFLSCKKIMVTGTNGKTTTVTMIEKLLNLAGYRAKSMGNIGYPVSQVVLDGTELDYAVIEVSSFQLEHVTELHADIALVLNLAPDHLDRYENYRDYTDTKKRICLNQTETDSFLYNNEDGICRRFVTETQAKKIPVGLRAFHAPVYIKDNFFMCEDVTVCHVRDCRLRGEHNRFNLLMALNVGYEVGINKEVMARLVREYALPPNRVEYVTTIRDKSYYNDSKGTNIHACRFAIDSLEGSIGLIVGGSDKNEDFCDFFDTLDERVKFVAITGGNAEKIFDAARKMGFCEAEIFSDLRESVRFLTAKEGIENVLLSPCCASFDRYRNYNERGEKFKEVVYEMDI